MLPLLRISCARRALTPLCGHASPRSSSSAQGAQVTPSCLPFTSWVLRMERDLVVLLSLQCEDGGWEPSWVYKYSSLGLKLQARKPWPQDRVYPQCHHRFVFQSHLFKRGKRPGLGLVS